MLKTVEGIYRDGRIELANLPQDVGDRSSVLITFLDAGILDPVQLRRLIDQLETIAGTQQGLDQVNAGQTGQPVRQHDAFLNSYAPEDEGLYDDYPTR